jgi:hypothetical protein
MGPFRTLRASPTRGGLSAAEEVARVMDFALEAFGGL